MNEPSTTAKKAAENILTLVTVGNITPLNRNQWIERIAGDVQRAIEAEVAKLREEKLHEQSAN